MAMVTTLVTPPYGGGYYRYSPQPPPSPPMEEYRCSLPSISNLLGLADAGSPTSEASSVSRNNSPRPEATVRRTRQHTPYSKTDSRPGSSYSKVPHQCRGLPPTPPMISDASFDNHHPSTAYAPGRYYEATPPLEADIQRHHSVVSRPAQQSLSTTSPTPSPLGNYYPPPMQLSPPAIQASGIQLQRPLPQAFPPPPPVPVTVAPSSGGYVWQHHHYLNPSHGASFPPTQDRYICQTCNKAFSRPSSLRIHSHSHTGEKPFKCPHIGCGKAFSVRSNMKRHERGCHGFDAGKGPIMLA